MTTQSEGSRLKLQTTAARIRPATSDDLNEIVAIYNDVVATSSTIWSETPTTFDERLQWLNDKANADYPVFVGADQDAVLGFISAGPFRPWPGYANTCEHSIHVRSDARNRGIGRLLLETMEQTLRIRGTHVIVAGIDADNEGSIRFHARAGFTEVARMPEVGSLRGQWRDLVLLQKLLT
jgi:L-amino acid N-acyltransferase